MILEHIKEFSRHAHSYDSHTCVQKEVAKYLVSGVKSKPKSILDLGCGSGEVYKNIDWEIEHFVGVDSSQEMSDKHPTCKDIDIINEDFESSTLALKLQPSYDLLISSSALQWSHDIEKMIQFASFTCKEGAFAVFTDKTFETIYTLSGLEVFLPNAQALLKIFEKYFTCKSEIKTFKISFSDNLSAFRYIKQSGVSGGKKRLSVSQTKSLIQNYPLTYLEFEVLFIWGTPKTLEL
ncbi:MAG: methyltransferase domain-containing protein [Campylobacteraceae bacterium]|nr:methyltransferase domain-containing protein [Campylobacteraceae bacterium]